MMAGLACVVTLVVARGELDRLEKRLAKPLETDFVALDAGGPSGLWRL
jgi:hypothetical protein